MHCFNHPDVAAIGLCKHCCKGLCTACAADLGHGLACNGSHETQVAAADALMQRAQRIQSTNTSNKYVGPLFFIVLGLLFTGWGYVIDGSVASFATIMGIPFVVYGLFLLNAARKAFVQPKA